MLFWSAAREDAGAFFCNDETCVSRTWCQIEHRCLWGLFVPYLWLLSLLCKGLFALLLPALLLPGKVLGAGDLVQCLLVKPADIDFRRCGNDVSGVHSADGHSVDLERAGHK
jgi:hypothetical protein